MMTKHEILSGLNEMSEAITSARDGLSQDHLMNMDGMETKVRDIVASIADLPPEDAVEMRPVLADLLVNFQGFSQEVESKLSNLGPPVAAKAD
jgi:DNA-directed RNA polymerase subunit F